MIVSKISSASSARLIAEKNKTNHLPSRARVDSALALHIALSTPPSMFSAFCMDRTEIKGGGSQQIDVVAPPCCSWIVFVPLPNWLVKRVESSMPICILYIHVVLYNTCTPTYILYLFVTYPYRDPLPDFEILVRRTLMAVLTTTHPPPFPLTSFLPPSLTPPLTLFTSQPLLLYFS